SNFIRVMMRNCPTKDIHFEFSDTKPQISQLSQGPDPLWELTFPADSPQPITFRLRAEIPLTNLSHFSMPSTTVLDSQQTEQWLAITGTELRPEKTVG